MFKTVEFHQHVAIAISHPGTWKLPTVRDRSRGKFRNIRNRHLVKKKGHRNGHDRYEKAIFTIEKIMKGKGWNTHISTEDEVFHEHLKYRHHRLKCWK